jgi:type I restriction enzyme R subunit
MEPEAKARKTIDRWLNAAGWQVQDYHNLNLGASRGVAVREYPLRTGFADYLLFVDRKAVGVVEAKAEGMPLSGVTHQSQKYSVGLPDRLPAWRIGQAGALPFLYESTGVETVFTNGLDPDPRSRYLIAFHQPSTLQEWAQESETLRARLCQLPPLITHSLWPAQIEAIQNLEQSFAENRPRALIQMATGSGKTFTAVNFVYRLIKHAKAKRVLFLVDRGNLGRQTLKEFQQFNTPDDGRKFTEFYNVQHLQSNVLDPVSKVCITTIQRLYSMLRGEAEFDPSLEEQSLWESDAGLAQPSPREVTYNRNLPIEYFDFIITDECHRSIYNLWRQVLEYFDAFLIGLTATPSTQTFGFFNQNLVMEYSRERAVTDGVNVDGEVYRIRTQVTEQGGRVEAGYTVGVRNRLTRAQRWQQLDEELTYSANQLDRDVVTPSQIRTVIRTFRDRLFTEIFPGRTVVPKTLIFAKDDSHAETIVDIVREEFGKGNDFCQKITYRVSGKSPEELIAEFRNSYNPRIAVTVDMIATGTDIKPLEILLFLRSVKSRVLYEQMLGRGTRVISANDLSIVTSDAHGKERFVIVDAVGVTENPKFDTHTLERKRTVPFAQLLQTVATGAYDADTLTSLASRLAKLERKLTPQDAFDIAAFSGGLTVQEIAHTLLDAVDPDRQLAAARALAGDAEPTAEQIDQAAEKLMQAAAQLLSDNPRLRNLLVEIQQRNEQIIDVVTVDVLREAGFNQDATERARQTVDSFRHFIETHKDEITALQLLYSRPYSQRALTYRDIEELAKTLEQPPHSWTTERLWQAYAQLERDKVRGASTKRILTDVISLVRHALQLDDELVPYPDQVQQRYQQWLADQAATGRTFTPEQRWWLDKIAEQIGVNLSIQPTDFDYGEFFDRGGRLGAMRALGQRWLTLVDEMNQVLTV